MGSASCVRGTWSALWRESPVAVNTPPVPKLDCSFLPYFILPYSLNTVPIRTEEQHPATLLSEHTVNVALRTHVVCGDRASSADNSGTPWFTSK